MICGYPFLTKAECRSPVAFSMLYETHTCIKSHRALNIRAGFSSRICISSIINYFSKVITNNKLNNVMAQLLPLALTNKCYWAINYRKLGLYLCYHLTSRMQFSYLHGIIELLGIILVWGIHESYNEPLKVATQFWLQAFNQILLNMHYTVR